MQNATFQKDFQLSLEGHNRVFDIYIIFNLDAVFRADSETVISFDAIIIIIIIKIIIIILVSENV